MTGTRPGSAALIVVAAGTGQRLGLPVHKALVGLAGRPLVEHTLLALLSDARLDPVILVGHAQDGPALDAVLARLPRPVRRVVGGARRQDSVAAGLAALGEDAPDVVLVHDGARPFVPMEALPALVRAVAGGACALLALPVTDTLKRADADRKVATTVPREHLWAAQTPQAAPRRILADLLRRADRDGLTVTDEASLFEAAGLPVHLVEGSRRNVKVTTREDLDLARALLAVSERGAREPSP